MAKTSQLIVETEVDGLYVPTYKSGSNYRFNLESISKPLEFKPANLYNNVHVGLGSAYFEFPNGSIGLLTREASNHVTSTDGKIVLYTSNNGGRDVNPVGTTVLNTSGIDDRDFSFAVMDNNRVGLVVSRPTTTPIFLYSDNNGSSWSTVNISAADVSLTVWQNMIKYPTSAGGADDGGWICFGAISGVLDGIHAIYTTDNGSSWSDSVVLSAAAAHKGSEATVEFVEELSKWVMVYRNNNDVLGPAYVSTSTNLTTWTTPEALGFTLGRHPPFLFWDSGVLWLYAAIRDYTDHVSGWENKLIRAGISPADINSNDWSSFDDDNFKTVITMDNILGYMTLRRDNSGGIIGSIAYNQSDDQSSSKIALITSTKSLGIVGNRSILPTTYLGKSWVIEWDRYSNEYLKQTGFGLTLTAGVSSLFATITYPKTFPAGWLIRASVTWTWTALTSVSVTQLGNIRVSSITESSCLVTFFSTAALNTGVDTATIDITLEGYPPTNTDK